MTIDIGRVGIWTAAFESHPAGRAIEAAISLEEMGFRGLWINETTGRDPFVLSALLLSATSSLTVATGIANVYARDAVTMSASQKALSEAFPGRFLLGLGVSSPVLVERVRQHSYDKPFSYLESYLDQMDAAPYSSVPPAQPINRVLAALGPRMLGLAASRANGVHPYLTTPDHTALARQIVGPEPFVAPEQMVVFETDAGAAREIGRSYLSFYLRAPGYLANLRRLGFGDEDWANPKEASDRLVDSIVAWGKEPAIAARIQEHHDAGADHVCVQVLAGGRDLTRTGWRRLADLVL